MSSASPRTHARAHAATPAAGPVGRWLAGLGLGYVPMLAASIGGLVWLAAIHLVLMRHGPALMLSVLSGLGALVGMCRARGRARAGAAARPNPNQASDSEVKP